LNTKTGFTNICCCAVTTFLSFEKHPLANFSEENKLFSFPLFYLYSIII